VEEEEAEEKFSGAKRAAAKFFRRVPSRDGIESNTVAGGRRTRGASSSDADDSTGAPGEK